MTTDPPVAAAVNAAPAVPSGRAAFTYIVFFLSGVAGLGYEIVWSRMFAVGLGHELAGVLAILAAYFGGFAVGAFLLDGRISRSRTPGRWYAGLELVIGVWGVATVWLVPQVAEWSTGLVGVDPAPWRQWLVAFGVPWLTFLPATAAMGATLPAMDRFITRLLRDGRQLAGVYAANTGGAVVGAMASAFVIIPLVGFRTTVLTLAAFNIFCAAVTWFHLARHEETRGEVGTGVEQPLPLGRINSAIFISGFLGVGYQVLGVRVMAQVLENTIYSFASALGVFLATNAIGAALYQRFLRTRPYPATLAGLVLALSLSCLAGLAMLYGARSIYEGVYATLGGGSVGSIAGEVVLAAAVFAAPAAIMGGLFTHLAIGARRPGGGVGRALGLNTLGGALAPILFGVVLAPLVGSRLALLIAACGYVVILLPGRPALAATPAAVAVLMAFALPPLRLVTPRPGGQVLEYRDGVMAAVAVVSDAGTGRYLKVNDRFSMGGISGPDRQRDLPGVFAERRQGQIPLLMHADPKRALYLGLGSGVTMSAVKAHPGLEAVGVELLPEAVELLGEFDPWSISPDDPNVTLLVADARRYVQATDETFDVIVADLFHPARDGAGALYTVEHFRAIRDRLAADGLFCQWLPLHQLDEATIRLIVRTFLEVFPDAQAVLAHYNVETPALGLFGFTGDPTRPSDWLTTRLADRPSLAQPVLELGLDSPYKWFGTFFASGETLQAFAGAGPLNTDDHPRVIFMAPRLAYERATSYGRLRALLDLRGPDDHAAFIAPPASGRMDRRFLDRMRAYLDARDVFLQGIIAWADGRRPEAFERLFESLAMSTDFTTAYPTILQFAQFVYPEDRQLGESVLVRLHATDRSNPTARNVLGQLRQRYPMTPAAGR